MEGAIRWSYDLLRPPEQALLRRLSVFAGGWTLDAAEEIADVPEGSHIDVLEGMAALMDQSLVRQMPVPDVARRFTMLETLRQFGMARLVEDGEADAIQARHLDWCVRMAETAEHELTGSEQAAWLQRLETEHDNIRAALGTGVGRGSEARLRLAGAMWRFWWWHGHLSEGRAWLANILSSKGTEPSAWRGKALMAAGVLAREQGDYAHANTVLNESLCIRRELGDVRGTAQSLNILGLVAMNQGNLDEAIGLYEEALALYRDTGFPLGIANVLNNLASATRDKGEFGRAAALYEESIGLYRELGEKRGVAITLHNFGRVKRDMGDLDVAMECFEQSMAMEQMLGDRLNMAMTLHNMGRVANDRSDLSRAVELFTESLRIRIEFGDRLGCIKVVEDVAGLAAEREPETAVQLYGAAEALREALGAPVPPADRNHIEHGRALARAALQDPAYGKMLEAGRATDTERAVEKALAFLQRLAPSPPRDQANMP
jgi:tetratricopeptide (TPR) repeat protein